MNKAIIFDLDGTLIHSLPDIYYSINVTRKKFGKSEVSYQKVMDSIGNGARRLVDECFDRELSQDQLDEVLKFYNEHYTSGGSPKTRLFDGVDDLLRGLKERGYKLAILTNKPQVTTDEVYKKYMSEYEFDLVVGQSGKVKCKPDKTATLQILDKLGVLPENTFFIGDGETDVLTALNSNTKGIAVLWGYRSKEQLEKAGAKVFAKDIDQLKSILF